MRPFFLTVGRRELFCVYHPPAPGVARRGAALYVPPFAEEMHKSRRMAAEQARRFARRGVGVLVLDLTGTGDSSGDFADARWERWLEDVARGLEWLRSEVAGPVLLWGLRLGSLLAVEAAQAAGAPPSALVLWQPVSSGKSYLTEVLRIKVAGELIAGRKSGVEPLRAEFRAGRAVEVAGYEIHAELGTALDARQMQGVPAPPVRVAWLEVVTSPDQPMPMTAQQSIDALARAGAEVQADTVTGVRFWDWNIQDITECPALLDRTDRFADEVFGSS